MDFVSILKLSDKIKLEGNNVINTLSEKGYKFKDERELATFESFVKYINKGRKNMRGNLPKISDKFLFGYVLPSGLSGEFDLLRIGENYIVNIELKSGNTTVEEQYDQLNRHNFLLKFLKKKVILFSYNMDGDVLISANSSEVDSEGVLKWKKSTPKVLLKVLANQLFSTVSKEKLDALFAPKKYLVSPLNDTEAFFNSQYLLTNNQDQIKKLICRSKDKLFAIKGGAGTGKSLLLYDLAITLINNGQKVCVVPCSIITKKHKNIKKYGIEIKEIKNIEQINIAEYDYILIDEFQRMKKNQRDNLLRKMAQNNTKLVLFYDSNQTLSRSEMKNDNGKFIEDILSQGRISGQKYDLKASFRINPAMLDFIDKLMSHGPKDLRSVSNQNKDIEVMYCANENSAIEYLESISGEFVVLSYTGANWGDPAGLSPFIGQDYNTHRVIGQEFTNVAIPLNKAFVYKKEKKRFVLGAKNSEECIYDPCKMLYQNLTRAKHKVRLVIVGNKPLFDRIEALLSNS
ncbi:DNA/RNA helicase domain-containing protein [uncultured Abiotrophia sp.]|uniref:DNA/RNA helicase domain-containing protein n=1 Tax=uncultured Abiotrophia sp. TaxID=316094 RepID=UPI0028E5959A|nr:DNA/RNA helicase domain-containing protein [uncultured Abiotrophia sp.]